MSREFEITNLAKRALYGREEPIDANAFRDNPKNLLGALVRGVDFSEHPVYPSVFGWLPDMENYVGRSGVVVGVSPWATNRPAWQGEARVRFFYDGMERLYVYPMELILKQFD